MPGPNSKQPCKGCTDRTTGGGEGNCHETCAAYLAYQKEMREKRIFVMRENTQRGFPSTVRYNKSSGRYVAPKGINHKKER